MPSESLSSDLNKPSSRKEEHIKSVGDLFILTLINSIRYYEQQLSQNPDQFTEISEAIKALETWQALIYSGQKFLDVAYLPNGLNLALVYRQSSEIPEEQSSNNPNSV